MILLLVAVLFITMLATVTISNNNNTIIITTIAYLQQPRHLTPIASGRIEVKKRKIIISRQLSL
ncbi:MAG: hypothetical protein WAM14_02695 [Candidatus Nitrosopolaris sp.]